MPANLTEPCPPFALSALATNGDLTVAYVMALEWGQDCRNRQRDLANAVRSR